MSTPPAASPKLTAPALRSYKALGKKLVVVTAYVVLRVSMTADGAFL